jgi:soluble lytic murein transglycosylase
MKTLLALFILLTPLAQASSGQAYLQRFMTYQQWSQNLPKEPGEDFVAFIDEDSPLAKKLREKWLYQLAHQKDWANYSKHYKPSADLNLQCFAQIANDNEGKTKEAFAEAKSLWLTGETLPPVCNALFDRLKQSEIFNEGLITERLNLALEKRNLDLARYLLKQYKEPRLKDEQLLATIYQNPRRISQLTPGNLHNAFYLFGLKRLIPLNMEEAIKLEKEGRAKGLINEADEQAFLVQLSIYKAMRNHDDEPLWFAKIKPAFYNDSLLDWQIRFALKRENWSQVESLINQSKEKDKPVWLYWLARALEAQGQSKNATEHYQTVAKSRNYYGFLAAMHLNQKPNFENEKPITQQALLAAYQPFMDSIKNLYRNKQLLAASRLLNDFVSELPREDKIALIYWVANDLRWYDKALYLSNTDDLNNQLALRFPVIYSELIKQFAQHYQIPDELVYAIIRQESGFKEDAVSSAGARGLMQIMPYTASVVAKREKIAYKDKNQLFSSGKNINIGIAYLSQLKNRYRQHPVLVAAAYNAGPSQVNYWLKNHEAKEMDIWIDTLPWHETRNYLKNIIAFYAVYQFRLGQKPDLKSFMIPL